MVIAPFGQLKFMEDFVYLGIYARAGLSCKIAVGFGPSCLKPLQFCFTKSPSSPSFIDGHHRPKFKNQNQTDQDFKDTVER